MSIHNHQHLDVLAAAPVGPAPMMQIDHEHDVSTWLGRKFTSAIALMSLRWDDEADGADAIASWIQRADLIGLMIVSADGGEEILTRAEAITRLTMQVVMGIEAEATDSLI